jgi:hypothetical protein
VRLGRNSAKNWLSVRAVSRPSCSRVYLTALFCSPLARRSTRNSLQYCAPVPRRIHARPNCPAIAFGSSRVLLFVLFLPRLLALWLLRLVSFLDIGRFFFCLPKKFFFDDKKTRMALVAIPPKRKAPDQKPVSVTPKLVQLAVELCTGNHLQVLEHFQQVPVRDVGSLGWYQTESWLKCKTGHFHFWQHARASCTTQRGFVAWKERFQPAGTDDWIRRWLDVREWLLQCVQLLRESKYRLLPVLAALQSVSQTVTLYCALIEPLEALPSKMQHRLECTTEVKKKGALLCTPGLRVPWTPTASTRAPIPKPKNTRQLVHLLKARCPNQRQATKKAFEWLETFLGGDDSLLFELFVGVHLPRHRWTLEKSQQPELCQHPLNTFWKGERTLQDHVRLRVHMAFVPPRAVFAIVPVSFLWQRLGHLWAQLAPDLCRHFREVRKGEASVRLGPGVVVPRRLLYGEKWDKLRASLPSRAHDDFGDVSD